MPIMDKLSDAAGKFEEGLRNLTKLMPRFQGLAEAINQMDPTRIVEEVKELASAVVEAVSEAFEQISEAIEDAIGVAFELDELINPIKESFKIIVENIGDISMEQITRIVVPFGTALHHLKKREFVKAAAAVQQGLKQAEIVAKELTGEGIEGAPMDLIEGDAIDSDIGP